MLLKDAIRRALLYIGLAAGGIAVIALLVAFSIYTGIETRGSWLALVVWTPVIFWLVMKSSKQYWRHPTYWLLLAALMGMHLVAFVTILRAYPEWRPVWFVPISIVEGGLLAGFVELVLARQRFH